MLQENDKGSTYSFSLWWPIVGASALIIAFAIATSVVRTLQVYPRDAWESIIVADAYRASVGLPVYTDPKVGHATHIYGPLITYTIGMIFKLTGVSFMAGHLVPSVASLCIIAALAMIYFRRLPWVFFLAGVAMLMSLNLRAYTCFSSIKSDMPALGFALLALVLAFQAMERRRWACYPFAIVSFCVAYLFKQTAAMFTLVPLLSVLLRQRGSIVKWLAAAAAPVAIVLLILLIAAFAPYVHYYMIVVVSRWPVREDMLAASPLRFAGLYPLVPLALCLMIVVRPSIHFGDPKLRWLVAASVGALPGSFLAYSKIGGGLSSFLPALLPLIVLSIVGIAAAWEALREHRITPTRTHAFAWLMAVVMTSSAVETSMGWLQALFVEAHGDANYPRVVEHVRKLKGRVVCPDDPTIPIVALGQPGRSSCAEGDASFTTAFMPEYYVAEIMSADYVVLVNSAGAKFVDERLLRGWNFVPSNWDGPNMGVYSLWRRNPPLRRP